MQPLNDFARGYVETALWLADEAIGRDAGLPDLAPEALAQLVAEAAAFEREHAQDLWDVQDFVDARDDTPDAKCGYLFWLNRNGHGTGFWDYIDGADGYAADALRRLDAASHAAGERHLYRGDDGRVYVFPHAVGNCPDCSKAEVAA